MLECFHELKKGFTIGRKRMRHLAAAVFFIQKASMDQRAGMLGNGLKIRLQPICNLLNRNPIISFNRKQDINSPVVGRAFKITFQLF